MTEAKPRTRSDKPKQAKPKLSKADTALLLSRRQTTASWASAVGTIIAAAIAGYALLSTDMLRENIKLQSANGALNAQNDGLRDQQADLQSKRIDLLTENGRLREAQQLLRSQNAEMLGQLDSARSERARLIAFNASIRSILSARNRELAGKRSEVARLDASATALRLETGSLTSSLEESTGTLLRAAMRAHLAGYQPKMADIINQPFYQYLIDPDDLASVSPSAAGWVMIASPISELDADDIAGSCPIQDGVRGLAFSLAYTGMKMTFTRTPLADPIFARTCAYLGKKLDVWTLRGKRRPKATVFDLLRKPGSEFVYLSMLAGKLEGLLYEEFKIRSFWFPAFGNLYDTRIFSRASAAGEPLPFVEPGGPVTLPFTYDMAGTFRAVQAEMAQPALDPIKRRFQELDTAWMAFLQKETISLGMTRAPILNAGKFSKMLPRFKVAEIGSARFLTERDAVRRFDYQVRCVAETFRSQTPAYSVFFDQEADGCKMLERSTATMRARLDSEGLDSPDK